MLSGDLAARAEKIREQSLRQKLDIAQTTALISRSLSKQIREQPENSTHNTKWSVEDQALIDKVTPYLYALPGTRREIELGPSGPMARTGMLQKNLINMIFLFDQINATTSRPDNKQSTSDICNKEDLLRRCSDPEIGWSAQDQSRIDWFRQNRQSLPTGQFYLDVCATVQNPEKFYAQLEIDIAKGPKGPRAKYGVLQDALEKLKNLFEKRT